MWHITLPAIKPTIVILLILNLAGLFSSNFDQIYNLYNNYVLSTGDVMSTYLYRISLGGGTQFEVSTAISLVSQLLGLVVVLATNKIVSKMDVMHYNPMGSGKTRDDLLDLMTEKYGVRCIVQYYPLYRYPLFQKKGDGDFDCPVLEKWWDNSFSFPWWCNMDEAWQDYFVKLYARYAAFRPNILWVEDDFRLHNHDPLLWGGCFCPAHMASSQNMQIVLFLI